MKQLLKYELAVQMILIIILLSTFITYISLEDRLFSRMFIIDFFVLASVQYTVSVIKFFNKKYLKTDSRGFYMYTATFVVISFLLYLLSDALDAKNLVDILGAVGITWVILSPVLIFQSLFISWSDSKNKIQKQDLIDGNSQKII